MSPIPQINNLTGLSKDYINEFAGRVSFIRLPHKRERVHEFGPIRKYREYFHPNQYPSVLSVIDHPHVRKLDEIVDEMNLKLEQRDYLGVLELYSHVEILIYGRKLQ